MIVDVISVTILIFGIVIVLKTVSDFRISMKSTPSIFEHDYYRKTYAVSFNDVVIGILYFIIGMILFVRLIPLEIAFISTVIICVVDKAMDYMEK